MQALQDEKGQLYHKDCIDVAELDRFEEVDSEKVEGDARCIVCDELLDESKDPQVLEDEDDEDEEDVEEEEDE